MRSGGSTMSAMILTRCSSTPSEDIFVKAAGSMTRTLPASGVPLPNARWSARHPAECEPRRWKGHRSRSPGSCGSPSSSRGSPTETTVELSSKTRKTFPSIGAKSSNGAAVPHLRLRELFDGCLGDIEFVLGDFGIEGGRLDCLGTYQCLSF